MALTYLAEMGLDERMISGNAMTMAADILHDELSKKTRKSNYTINGEDRPTSRKVLMVGNRKDGWFMNSKSLSLFLSQALNLLVSLLV